MWSKLLITSFQFSILKRSRINTYNGHCEEKLPKQPVDRLWANQRSFVVYCQIVLQCLPISWEQPLLIGQFLMSPKQVILTLQMCSSDHLGWPSILTYNNQIYSLVQGQLTKILHFQQRDRNDWQPQKLNFHLDFLLWRSGVTDNPSKEVMLTSTSLSLVNSRIAEINSPVLPTLLV